VQSNSLAVLQGNKYHPGSRHQYGDAVDVGTTTISMWDTFHADGKQLGACVEPRVYQGNSYTHAHLDWRTQATVGPHYSYCPSNW
jgi:hypothetical protein